MSVNVILPSTSASDFALVKLESGEYTAASVAADPSAAAKLELVREKDGNYGETVPAPVAGVVEGQSSPTVLAGLTSLNLGGA